jgi:hypothetical protein
MPLHELEIPGLVRTRAEGDFTVKSESLSRKRKGKREYLNDAETMRMMKELEKYFESKVEIPLIRHGKRQRIETLINEEALLLAKFLRDEKKSWTPRIASTQVYFEG